MLGVRQVDPIDKGTTVSKKYQKIDDAARAMAMPAVVSVTLAEIVADVKEGLLALAVGAGVVMAAGWRSAKARRGRRAIGASAMGRAAGRRRDCQAGRRRLRCRCR